MTVRRKRRGSIAVEAAVAFSISMLIIMAVFASIMNLYADDSLGWAAIGTQSGVGLAGNVAEAFGSEVVSAATLTAAGNIAYKNNINRRLLAGMVDKKLALALPDDFGTYTLNLGYDYKMPGFRQSGEMFIPVGASFTSDGLDFEDDMVYITNTGKKYHIGSCMYLRKSKHGVGLKDAKKRGYTACKNCRPKK